MRDSRRVRQQTTPPLPAVRTTAEGRTRETTSRKNQAICGDRILRRTSRTPFQTTRSSAPAVVRNPFQVVLHTIHTPGPPSALRVEATQIPSPITTQPISPTILMFQVSSLQQRPWHRQARTSRSTSRWPGIRRAACEEVPASTAPLPLLRPLLRPSP